MPETLHIASVLGKKYAMSQEDASKIFSVLKDAVETHKNLLLSFKGLETCSTIFLRKSLGDLYLSFGTEVDEYIHFIDVQQDEDVLPEQLELLRKRALNPAIYRPIFNLAIGEA